MLNFAVGPVPSNENVKKIGGQDVPYFRTAEFSEVMLESERLLCKLAKAPADSRAVFSTTSGTGAMESVVMCTLDKDDRALVVDGGSFGHRFREMLALHGIQHDAIELTYGTALIKEDLAPYEGKGYTAFLVNLGETSQGILYDADLIGDFCRRDGLFLIVDGISSFLADPFDMANMGADVLITDAQKGLACAPGVAPIVLSPRAIERVGRIESGCMYLDISLMLENGKRGQTPFTPAVSTLLQINERLHEIGAIGVDEEVRSVAAIARDFRQKAAGLPLDMRLVSPSNAVTYITTQGYSAKAIFQVLKDEYSIWICPNGGQNANSSFRVGHIGAHTTDDNSLLIAALYDLKRRGYMGTDR